MHALYHKTVCVFLGTRWKSNVPANRERLSILYISLYSSQYDFVLIYYGFSHLVSWPLCRFPHSCSSILRQGLVSILFLWHHLYIALSPVDRYLKLHQLFTRGKELTDHSILKYVIVGDSAVGKSSLLIRLTDDRFNLSGLEPTLGVEFGSRILGIGSGKRVKIQCTFYHFNLDSIPFLSCSIRTIVETYHFKWCWIEMELLWF